jgi:hypothetical protein
MATGMSVINANPPLALQPPPEEPVDGVPGAALAVGITELDAADAGPVPAALVAVTVKV